MSPLNGFYNRRPDDDDDHGIALSWEGEAGEEPRVGAGRGGDGALGMSDTSVSETPCQTVDRLVCQPGVLLRVLAGPQELGGR